MTVTFLFGGQKHPFRPKKKKFNNRITLKIPGNSLGVCQLRLYTFTVGGMGSISCPGTKTPHMPHSTAKGKKTKKNSKSREG